MRFWFVCDGEVERYRGQEADWKRSTVVLARTPEEALVKVMLFHHGRLGRTEAIFGKRRVEVIA